MKKLFLSALIAATTLAAGAKSYVIYSGATLGPDDTTGSITVGSWNHQEYADADAPGGKKMGVSSGEWYAELPCTINPVDANLVEWLANENATLQFYVKTQVNGNLNVDLNKISESGTDNINESYTVTNLNTNQEWRKISLNLRKHFPKFVEGVKAGDKVELPKFSGGFGQYFYLEFADIRIVEGDGDLDQTARSTVPTPQCWRAF